MNNEEAKFILSAYGPGGEDASDPKFAEALEQVSRDPELAGWFKEEHQFDCAMSEALCSVPIPRDLRASILAGGKISRPHFWAGRRTLLALAAGIVLLAALAGVWLNRPPRLDRWQEDALAAVPKILSRQIAFDYKASDVAALQQWLQAQNAPAPPAIPASLQSVPTLGCKTISSGGKPVTIICFRLPTNEMVHFVVTDAADVTRPPPARPQFVQQDGWKTASWTANGRACMLATKAPERELREVLARSAQAGPTDANTV